MDQAIVLACGIGLNGESLNFFSNTQIAEVVQLKRLLINAQRAGISNFTIVHDGKNRHSILKIVSDKRLQSTINWVTVGNSIRLNEDRIIILQSNLLIHTSTIKGFIDKVSNTNTVSILSTYPQNFGKEPENEGKNNSFSNGGRVSGLLVADRSRVIELLESCDVKSWMARYFKNGKVNYINPTKGYWMDLENNGNSFKEAENLIFSNVGKTATGWIARNINGRVSLPISRHLIKTPLTPNMISLLINVIGMLCGPFYATGHPVLGAIFMQIATILDRCDGEVARVKLLETKKGQWVDTLSDQLTVLSFIIGVSLGYYFQSGKNIALILGGINLSIFIFFLIWSFYFLLKYTESGSLVAYFEVDKIIDKKNSSLVRKFIALLRPMSRRNFYSLGFLVVAIFGGYPWVLGILTFALILSLIHQVEDIIKISKLKNKTISQN